MNWAESTTASSRLFSLAVRKMRAGECPTPDNEAGRKFERERETDIVERMRFDEASVAPYEAGDAVHGFRPWSEYHGEPCYAVGFSGAPQLPCAVLGTAP